MDESMEWECGIDYDRLDTWRHEEALGVCTITLTPLPDRVLGTFALPRTLVRIEGPANDIASLYRRFELRFLSAGG